MLLHKMSGSLGVCDLEHWGSGQGPQAGTWAAKVEAVTPRADPALMWPGTFPQPSTGPAEADWSPADGLSDP